MNFNLYKALNEYKTQNANEAESLSKIKDFLNSDSNCFTRTNLKGHITASALVIDNNYNVLLNHHKFLDKWLAFGGHSDGDSNSLNVAKREVIEESGILEFDELSGKIFDVDVHLIPENKTKGEPAHYHYDIRFLFIAKDRNFKISNESKELKWVTIQQAKQLVNDPGIIRMLDKVDSLNK